MRVAWPPDLNPPHDYVLYERWWRLCANHSIEAWMLYSHTWVIQWHIFAPTRGPRGICPLVHVTWWDATP